MGKVILITQLAALMLFLFAGESSAQNIVKNGDFEGTTFVQFGDALPTSWALSPTDDASLSNCGVSSAVNAAIDLGPESGTKYMTFQSRETDGSQDCLWQSLPTVAGQKYLITFSVAITGGTIGSTSFLDPEWDSGGTNDTFLRNSLYYSPSTTVGPVPYQTFTFIETASKTSTTFYFHGVDSSGGSILVDNFSVVPAIAPAFTSAALPATGNVGFAYNYTMTASGSPTPTFAVTTGTLPNGLSLSTSGVILGTPTQTGLFTGTVTASNGVSPVATQNFSITIASGYSGWVSQEGLSGNKALQTAINAPDGLTNLLKYALGLHAFTIYSPGSPSLPNVFVKNDQGVNYLALTFNGVATDVTYTVQGSSDLSGSWSNIYTYKGAPAPGTITVEDSQSIPTTNSTMRFMRLQVSP